MRGFSLPPPPKRIPLTTSPRAREDARMVKDTPPTPAQTCGNCRHFEPARNEPPDDIRYGYCREREALERERHLLPHQYLLDVNERCFLVHGPASVPVFAPKVRP